MALAHSPLCFAPPSYWTLDLSKTNDKFGSAQDLKDLSSALHARGMYLMVDVVSLGRRERPLMQKGVHR
jgi:maltooligosyltrehalose synthase